MQRHHGIGNGDYPSQRDGHCHSYETFDCGSQWPDRRANQQHNCRRQHAAERHSHLETASLRIRPGNRIDRSSRDRYRADEVGPQPQCFRGLAGNVETEHGELWMCQLHGFTQPRKHQRHEARTSDVSNAADEQGGEQQSRCEIRLLQPHGFRCNRARRESNRRRRAPWPAAPLPSGASRTTLDRNDMRRRAPRCALD